jgi:DNA-binding transcriptional MocR family regulator
VHHLTDEIIEVKNIITECERVGNPNRAFEFFSTSKITFPGGGVAGCASSEENIKWLQKNSLLQLKTGDKINQYRHALFLKDRDGVLEHMGKHRRIIKPKFDLIDGMLDDSFGGSGIVKWNNPKGGYFINLELQQGKAQAVYNYCREHGVGITPAGSTFPYGKDPKDQYLRLAPTYPSMGDLEKAVSVLCEAIKEISKVKG